MKRNALRPVALIARTTFALSLFSLAVPRLMQATPQYNSHMRHADGSDSAQPDTVRRLVTFGATEALWSSADAKVGAQAMELSRAPKTTYRLIDTKMASADGLPEFQHRQIIAGVLFAPHAAHSLAWQDSVYPTTCEVRGWSVASSQLRNQSVVLLGYSDQTCADGWNRLKLSVQDRSQLMLERGHRVAQGHVRHACGLMGARRRPHCSESVNVCGG